MLAPIVLFTYNRLEHTQKTVEALKDNVLASESELFIFSDGGKDEESWQKVNEVREYLKTIEGFKKIEIFESQVNKGLANSIIEGVTKIVDEYGKIIVLEDDIITGRYFLKFMNDALEVYQNEELVGTVTGYLEPELNPKNNFFSKKGSSWGWATWKRTWDLFEADGQKLLYELEKKRLIKEFDFLGACPFSQMLQDQIAGKNNSWAIRFYASYFLHEKLNFVAKKSLIRNIGFDSSGTHCGTTKRYDKEVFNEEIKVEKQEVKENLAIKKIYISKNIPKKPFHKRIFNITKYDNRKTITILGIQFSCKSTKLNGPKQPCYLLGEGSVIYPEAKIENILEDFNAIKIGKNCHIRGRLLTFPSGGNIKIGDYCYIGEGGNIWSACNIEIGNNVLIAHNVDIFDSNTHPIDPIERHEHFKTIITTGHPTQEVNWEEKPVKICNNAWIAAKSIILKGVTIGEAAIVSAGSIVTKDVKPYTIVGGNPAKKIGDVPR